MEGEGGERERRELGIFYRKINYAINHDFVDLKSHHYLIYRHQRLKAMLGADTIHPKNLFKYLRKTIDVSKRSHRGPS